MSRKETKRISPQTLSDTLSHQHRLTFSGFPWAVPFWAWCQDGPFNLLPLCVWTMTRQRQDWFVIKMGGFFTVCPATKQARLMPRGQNPATKDSVNHAVGLAQNCSLIATTTNFISSVHCKMVPRLTPYPTLTHLKNVPSVPFGNSFGVSVCVCVCVCV